MTNNLKEKIGITEVSALTRWFRSRVGAYYNVRFEHGAETAYVDEHRNCVIPAPNSNMTVRDAIRLRGFGLHEMGHPKWQPEIFKIMRMYPTKPGSPLGGIFNLLLDVHSESLTASEYMGDAKALSQFGAVAGHDVYEKLAPQIKGIGSDKWPPNFEKMAAVMTAARNAEGTWNVGMMVGFDKLINELYTPWIRDTAVLLERKFKLTHTLVDKAREIDEYGIWDLSKQVYEYLWEKDPEQEIGGGGSGGKGKPEEGKEDGTKGESSSASGGKAGKDGEEEAERQEEKIPLDELLFSDHYETLVGGAGSGVGFDYTNYRKRAAYTPVDPASFKVTDYSKRGR